MKYIYRTFIIVAILLLSAFIYFGYSIRSPYSNKGVNKLEGETKEEALKKQLEKGINVFNGDEILRILILGVDKSDTVNQTAEQNGMRTDTIMLFSIDPKGKVQILSIPRDSYVKIHGYGKNKINAAFSDIVYPKDGGLKLTTQTVEDLLDVKINHYAIVDYTAVREVVDTLGGVDVEWNYPDYEYTDDWVVPPLKISMKNGINHLNGEQAMAYLRARKAYPNQDLGRIEAQQGFLITLFDKMKTPSIIFKIPKLIGIIDKNVETDLNYGEITYLANFGLKLDRENIKTTRVKGHNKRGVKIGKDEVEVLEINEEQAKQLAKDFDYEMTDGE